VTSPEYAVLVTAAGSSARMGGELKKEYRALEGVPVLAHAIRPFVTLGRFSRIVVTVPPGDIPFARELLGPHIPLAGVTFVEGGKSRQESVYLGLRAMADAPPRLVLIHDGARPWICAGLIQSVLAATESHDACVPVLEVSEAVKQVGEAGLILRHFQRRFLSFAQTPQGFSFGQILEAHEKARARGAQCADDGEIYDLFAGPVAWVQGEPGNRKITWPQDMEEG
jgi:2-C-methyl-D-erythritol 4-phosphate cytidylyltransferase